MLQEHKDSLSSNLVEDEIDKRKTIEFTLYLNNELEINTKDYFGIPLVFRRKQKVIVNSENNLTAQLYVPDNNAGNLILDKKSGRAIISFTEQ